jgi:hypothetical protein
MTWFQRPQPELGTEGEVVWRRVVAILIDLVLLGVISTALSVVAFPGDLTPVGSVVGVLISFAYYCSGSSSSS